MAKKPHLQLRSGRYYWRQRVPADIRPIIKRVEFVLSLKTDQLEIAQTMAREYQNQAFEACMYIRVSLRRSGKPDLEYMHRLAPDLFPRGNANIGMLINYPNFMVLDFDQMAIYEHFVAMGMPTNGPMVKTSRGIHVYFRGHSAFPKSASKREEYDVKVSGYIVIPPSVHASGFQYEWVNDPTSPLPELPPNIVDYLMQDLNLIDSDESVEAHYNVYEIDWADDDIIERPKNPLAYGNSALIKEYQYLSQLPKGERNQALNNCALKLGRVSATGETNLTREQAYQILKEACEQNFLIEDDGIDQFRNTFNSGWEAGSHMPLWRKEEKAKNGNLLSYYDLMGLPDPAWNIKNLIGQNDLVFVYGPSNTGKTYVSLDLALSAACGMNWCGQETKPGSVVYFASEGGGGIRQRLKAWVAKHNPTNNVSFYRACCPG